MASENQAAATRSGASTAKKKAAKKVSKARRTAKSEIAQAKGTTKRDVSAAKRIVTKKARAVRKSKPASASNPVRTSTQVTARGTGSNGNGHDVLSQVRSALENAAKHLPKIAENARREGAALAGKAGQAAHHVGDQAAAQARKGRDFVRKHPVGVTAGTLAAAVIAAIAAGVSSGKIKIR